MASYWRVFLAGAALVFCGSIQTVCAQSVCSSAVGDGPIAANPTRPSVTDGADVLQTGVVEVEGGWASGWPGGGLRQDSTGALYKIGLLCNVEVRVSGNAYQGQMQPNGRSATGFGDLWYSAQYRFVTAHKSTPSISVIYGAKEATASVAKGLGSGATDHVLAVTIGKQMGKNFWTFEEKEILSGKGGGGLDKNSELSLNVTRPLFRKLGIVSELYVDTRKNAANPAFASNLWALQYSLNSRMILDAGVDVGITDGGPHKRVFIGVSYAIGDIYRALRRTPVDLGR